MVKSQILNERSFDITDGERYLIVVITPDRSYSVFTRKYQSKPVISVEFKEAKLYKELKTAQNVVKEIFQNNEHYQESVIKIFQVKDLFEPRYFVQYIKKAYMNSPELKCYIDWYVIGENQVDTYLDHSEAQKHLDKYKRDLLEFYYSQIIKISNFELKKI
jgi:hypothetical protein